MVDVPTTMFHHLSEIITKTLLSSHYWAFKFLVQYSNKFKADRRL